MPSKVFGVYGKEKRKAAEGRWEKEKREWERERKRQTKREREKEREREGDIEGEYIGTDEEDSRLVFILQCKSFQSRTSRRANSLTVSDGFSHVEKSITAGACAQVISEKKKSRQTWTWCIMTVMMLIYTRSLWTRWLLFAIAAELDAATLLLKVLPLKRLFLSLSFFLPFPWDGRQEFRCCTTFNEY